MSERRVSVEYLEIESLSKWPRNPKRHDKEGIAESIDEFGYVNPIVIDETSSRIVAGHGRLDDLIKRKFNQEIPPLGIEVRDGQWLVPVLRGVAFESESQAERYLLADNRLVERGGYDDKALVDLLKQHKAAGALRGTGYSVEDVEALIERTGQARSGDRPSYMRDGSISSNDADEPEDPDAPRLPDLPSDGLTDPDEAPEIEEAAEPRTKTGDVWLLGDHRVMCGDSTDEATLEALMGDMHADLIFTDPPYNVGKNMDMARSYSTRTGIENGKERTWKSQAMAGLSSAPWDKDFKIEKFLGAVERFIPENGSIYICCSHETIPPVWEWMHRIDGDASHGHLVVWCKPNPMPSIMKRKFTNALELIAFCQLGKHVFNFPEEGHAPNWWMINKNQRNDLHPTQKPVAVPLKAIGYSSLRGQLVLDPFLGSGTTLIACEQMGRRCYGVEMSPAYVDVIVRRWQEFTGKQAISPDGELFGG